MSEYAVYQTKITRVVGGQTRISWEWSAHNTDEPEVWNLRSDTTGNTFDDDAFVGFFDAEDEDEAIETAQEYI